MYTKCNVHVVMYMHVCLYIYSANKNERTCRDVITRKLCKQGQDVHDVIGDVEHVTQDMRLM